jgi:hypothetical protein
VICAGRWPLPRDGTTLAVDDLVTLMYETAEHGQDGYLHRAAVWARRGQAVRGAISVPSGR